jgi:hypothetical protein
VQVRCFEKLLLFITNRKEPRYIGPRYIENNVCETTSFFFFFEFQANGVWIRSLENRNICVGQIIEWENDEANYSRPLLKVLDTTTKKLIAA